MHEFQAASGIGHSSEPLLELRDVSVFFGDVRAVDGVSAQFPPRGIVGLAGQNGAGKSTLFNLLCGTVAPSSGELRLRGAIYRPRSYRDAMRNGVFRVSQELSLIPNLTVWENVAFGFPERFRRAGFVKKPQTRAEVKTFLEEVGVSGIEVTRRAGDLDLGQQQVIEIARVLFVATETHITPPIILLDEPTAALTTRQVDFFAEQLRALRSKALVLLTSHRGQELLEYSDFLMVMRDGHLVASGSATAFSPDDLLRAILGHDPVRSTAGRTDIEGESEPILEVNSLRIAPGYDTLSFSLAPGEVLGLVSDGEMASRIIGAIAGVREASIRQIRVRGKRLRSSPVARLRWDMAFVPADRREQGLILAHPICWNATLPGMAAGRHKDFTWRPSREKRWAEALVARFGLVVARVSDPAASLSGGNQQRLLLARALAESPRVVLLDRPTRGVDAGAKARIYDVIRAASAEGVAFLITEDEIEAVCEVSNRVLLLDAGSGGLLAEWNSGSAGVDPTLIESELRHRHTARELGAVR
jgi:ribose transport system ATP-binding protein